MKRILLFAAAVAGVPALLSAQADAGPGGPPPPPMAQHGFAGPGARGMGPLGMAMPHKVITGEPYSADVTTSINQKLVDGNTISRTETGHVARDSEGRVYMEQNITGGPWAQRGSMTITFISDPVSGYSYMLNAKDKTAMRREFHARNGERSGEGSSHSFPGAKDNVETDLGQQSIAGIAASGKSITRTIPAGTIGNAQPIIEKSEVWTAPDLGIVLLSKHTDPRMGQSTYTLSNIQRTEPNASLFQVPSDYAIKDAPAR